MISPLYRKTDIACDLGRGDFIHVKEEDHAAKTDESNIKIGGSYPVAIQSMTNTKTEDVGATVSQILALEKAGCEIIRCAVPTMEAAKALSEIKKQIHIPLVADIHFDYRHRCHRKRSG